MKHFFLLIVFISSAYTVDPELIRCHQAVTAFKQQKYAQAYLYATHKKCTKLSILSRWHQLRYAKGKLKFSDYTSFIAANHKLPYIRQIKIKAEDYINTASRKEVLQWFKHNKPRTYNGAQTYLKILYTLGHKQQLRKTIKYCWNNITFNKVEERKFWTQYKQYIRMYDTKNRIDNIIKAKRYEDAVRNIHNFLPKNDRRYFLAKLHLYRGSSSAGRIYTSLTKQQRKKIDILKTYINFLQKKEQVAKIETLLQQEKTTLAHHSDDIWRIRYIAARDLLITQHYNRAYNILKNHNVRCKKHIIRCEWLLGFIAADFLQKHHTALKHFRRAYQYNRNIAIKSQLEYWIARSYKKLHKHKMYKLWLVRAAKKPTTFYGQIALQEMNKPIKFYLRSIQNNHAYKPLILSDQRTKLALFLKHIGQHTELIPILSKIAKTYKHSAQQEAFLTILKQYFPEQTCYIITTQMHNAHLHKESYPKIKYKFKRLRNPKLTHAVIKQESCFNKIAVSPANAFGLMQIIPSTAKRVAQKLKISVSKKELISNPKLNITLGNKYLNMLLKTYNNSPLLALSAYNAGEKNADKWVKRYGDPRTKSINTITWIELIPFTETRTYVKSVMAHYNVYRNL